MTTFKIITVLAVLALIGYCIVEVLKCAHESEEGQESAMKNNDENNLAV